MTHWKLFTKGKDSRFEKSDSVSYIYLRNSFPCYTDINVKVFLSDCQPTSSVTSTNSDTLSSSTTLRLISVMHSRLISSGVT